MLAYSKCFIVLLLVSAIKCENCVTYDFGSNFHNSFNNGSSVCDGMGYWKLGNYDGLSIQRPDEESELFITPDASLSCVSSYGFEMMSTGVVEVYVYMESTSQQDQVVVLANEVSSSGRNVVTGTNMLTPLSANYYDGWHVLRINLMGTGVFNGYVTFIGMASPGSTVIVDSFRYIPPQYDSDCHVYDSDFVTTSPLEAPKPEECITYDFETDFEESFNSDRGLCTGFTQWNLEKYTSLFINQPSSESQKFISPQRNISCVSSFPFQAGAGGVVEVNVYMESAANSDQIGVLMNRIDDEASDVVTGSTVLTPLDVNYVDGWHVLTISLTGGRTYTGYISLLGLASEESAVLVDSFRYIPASIDNDECKIYEEEIIETTTPAPVTAAPIGTGKECVTYNFEADFDKTFDTNNVLCSGYSSWHLGDYRSLPIDKIDSESRTFIAPNDTSSCVSSFTFRMLPGGTVAVNAYMKSVSYLDFIIVLAKKVVSGGVDTVAGFQLFYPSDESFVEGWNQLKITVTDFSIFDGYITLIGSTSEESIVLIDSFSYTPPNSSDTCEVY